MNYSKTPPDNGRNNDPENVYSHRVSAWDLELYEQGKVSVVKASCGKIWAPALVHAPDHPKCPTCFPIARPRFVISA